MELNKCDDWQAMILAIRDALMILAVNEDTDGSVQAIDHGA